GSRARERSAPAERTIYTFANGRPQPVQVKLGISDGIHTEAVEGVKENDVVVTGMIAQRPSAPAQPGSNPFSGSSRRF
ncbi:MAG: efflux RND transporter periplasmic adaptor subunit, partial [Verrucomicrobiota bacterium]|nr:efflux RND transporter periplasmic adaptor subunit [Verrucomicrobiota bacterium]